ncbi:MAG: hypothetical protein WDN03_00970 [Rhizomicrobium sp.]
MVSYFVQNVRRGARLAWAACVLALLGPPLLVWVVRGFALAAHCTPGPAPCRGFALGEALRGALTLAWSVGADPVTLIVLGLAAAIAGTILRRPLAGAACLLLLPLAAPILPMAAVYASTYPGCTPSEAGVGDCMLWGAPMGLSFHEAASVPWLVYGFAPYSFALALMLGIVGWFVARPRPAVRALAQAHDPFRVPDYRFDSRRDPF